MFWGTVTVTVWPVGVAVAATVLTVLPVTSDTSASGGKVKVSVLVPALKAWSLVKGPTV
jgi:hypothetical protein